MPWQEGDGRVPPHPPIGSRAAWPCAALSVPLRAATAAPSRVARPRPSGPLTLVLAGAGGLEPGGPPRETGSVPQTPAARREALRARRRRELVTELRTGGSVIAYAARQLSNGIGPEEAREVALESAAQLSMLSVALRKSVRLAPAHRRVLVGRLIGLGYTQEATAARAGVSVKTVQRDLSRPGRDSTT